MISLWDRMRFWAFLWSLVAADVKTHLLFLFKREILHLGRKVSLLIFGDMFLGRWVQLYTVAN